jgi:hypothetical protein
MRRRLVTKPKAWTRLNGQRQVFGRLMRFQVPYFYIARFRSPSAHLLSASRIGTDADHIFAGGLVVIHGIKLDDAMHIRKRDAQVLATSAATSSGNPVVYLLSRMQGGQQARAAHGNIFFDCRFSGERSISDMNAPDI